MPSPKRTVSSRTGGGFSISFPAMRGIQAGREFYVIMCPLRHLPKLFLFDEEPVPAELRAQRALNRNRVPALTKYIVDNRHDYVFSALTASIDGEMTFEAVQDDAGHTNRLGVLSIAMDARFLINDGQHRRAAIEDAMAIDPTLMEETIPIVIFGDEGLSRSQQMFADLNRHAIRPAKSIGVLYDHRDDESAVVRLVVLKSPFFRGVVETEKSNLSQRSGKLFTLSALYNATLSLFSGLEFDAIETAAAVARDFWEEVARHFPEWQQVSDRSVSAGEIRTEYLHSHGIALHALGKVGNVLLRQSLEKDDWVPSLQKLESIDWRRSNTKTWEGRAMIGGRVSKATNNVVLTTNFIKTQLGIALTPEEQRAEDNYLEGAR